MWPWIKRWRDWAMHDFWVTPRNGPQPQALHYSYEKAGLTLHDQPIPWNAEAVLVEALVRKPAAALKKADFQLRLSGQPPIPAEQMRRDENEERHRIHFRFPPPATTVLAELVWKNHSLGQLTLPILSRDEFIQHLRIQMPTLFVRMAGQSVACQTFVSTQCKGLLASALVTSPTSLVPILDLGLQVEFRSEREGPVCTVPAQLCSSQLAGRQALVSVVPPRFPRRMGAWLATWMLADRPLITQRVRAITQRQFLRSLRVSDTRFVVQRAKEGVSLPRHLPPLEEVDRVGPCFLVSSREPGMAGICSLQVRGQIAGAVQNPLLLAQEILITDGPTAFAPGTLDVADLGQLTGFELRQKESLLGVLSMRPAPSASFNGEGSFKAPADFAWSPAAEEELLERLGRLLNGPEAGK